MEKDEREELRGLFNAVWSAVPDGPGYDGKKWRRLAALVDKAARDPATAPCLRGAATARPAVDGEGTTGG